MKQHNKYSLSKKAFFAIVIYYIVIIVLGGIVSVIIGINSIDEISNESVLIDVFTVSISASAMLCCVQYVKRLYKACILEEIILLENSIKSTGNVLYFVTRPLFSCVFSIVLVFAILSGMFVVTGNLTFVLNEKIVYLCAMLSSIIGFSTGKILDRFGMISNEKIDRMI